MGRRYTELVDQFLSQLKNYFSKETTLTAFTDEKSYGMELQKQRLSKNGLRLESKFEQNTAFVDDSHIHEWTDGKYTGVTNVRYLHWEDTIYKGDAKIYHKKQNSMVYGSVIDAQKPLGAYINDTYACPNCGTPSKVGELKNGCSYCGTHFELTELFPKISNFYFVRNPNPLGSIRNKLLFMALPIAAAAGFLVFAISKNPSIGKGIGGILQLLFAFVFAMFYLFLHLGLFFVIGWVIYSLIASKTNFKMVKAIWKSSKRFENAMKKYSSEFSYDYFSTRIASIVEMILFSDNPDDLPIYCGEPLNHKFDDIVYSRYMGAVDVVHFNVVEDYCNIQADVYMTNYHYDGNKIKRSDDVIAVKLSRNIKKDIDLNFSIKAIQCPNCGGSFDASKHAICPYCDTKFDIRDEDWFVTAIKKR